MGRERVVKLLREMQLLDQEGELLPLDSMTIVDVSLDLEDEMGIVIPPTSLTPENFACIDSLVTMVEELAVERD